MKDRLSAAFGWIMDANWKTWIGHFLLGALIAGTTLAVGLGKGGAAWTVFIAFIYREASDLLAWALDDDPDKPTFHEKMHDGFLDLWSPLAGAAVVSMLF